MDEQEEDFWVATKDKDGNTFYFNSKTMQTQWDKPEGTIVPESEVEFAGEAEPGSSVEDTEYEGTPVGGGWIENTDAEGKTYWFNVDTKVSTWDDPLSSVAPEAANEASVDPVETTATQANTDTLEQELAAALQKIKDLEIRNEELVKENQSLKATVESLKSKESVKSIPAATHTVHTQTVGRSRLPSVDEATSRQSSLDSESSVWHLPEQLHLDIPSQVDGESSYPRTPSEGSKGLSTATQISFLKSVPLFHTFSEAQYNRLCQHLITKVSNVVKYSVRQPMRCLRVFFLSLLSALQAGTSYNSRRRPRRPVLCDYSRKGMAVPGGCSLHFTHPIVFRWLFIRNQEPPPYLQWTMKPKMKSPFTRL